MGTISDLQLRLLQHSCGLPSGESVQPPTDGHSAGSDITRAGSLILQGEFLEAVQKVSSLQALLDCSGDADAVHDAESYYGLVGRRAAAALAAAGGAGGASSPTADVEGVEEAPDCGASSPTAAGPLELEAVLVAGVACLHIFLQQNLTGPSYGGAPPGPLDVFAPPAVAKHCAEAPPRPPAAVAAAAIAAITGGGGGTASTPPTAAAAATVADGGAEAEEDGGAAAAAAQPDGLSGLGVDSTSRGDRWAQEQLQLDGEDLVGRCPAVQWLLLARRLLVDGLGLRAAAAGAAGEKAAGAGRAAGAGAAAEGCGGNGKPQQDDTQPQPEALSEPQEQEGAERSGTGRGASEEQGQQPALSTTGTAPSWEALPGSWSWWALRCVMMHQHALDGRSHTLLSEASQLITALLAPASPWSAHASATKSPEANGDGTAAPTAATAAPASQALTPGDAAALCGVLHLELALCQYAYGYVEAGRQYLVRSGELLGIEPQLTGALGKRTLHQVDPKAQLVVVASESNRAAPPSPEWDQPVESLGFAPSSSHPHHPHHPRPGNKELEGLADESDVLPAPVLMGEDGKLLDARYSGPEQALLLAWATAVKKGSSADDLQEWQMAPWVEAVLSQPRSVFITAAAARLHKIRHERTRGRTRERALLQMDQLAEAVVGAPPPPPPEAEAEAKPAEAGVEPAVAVVEAAAAAVASTSGCGDKAAAEAAVAGRRSPLSWAVWFPLQVSLRREAAEHYISMGLVGAAIRVFESLELWDSAITCYRLLGKKALAEELIKRRLAVTPDDPRLWCALGYLHMDDRYYEEAWQRSGRRHTRSQRSLARNAMRRKDYRKAATHWEMALQLNPLHPEAWFSLGFCYLRDEKHRKALRAFTRVTQQEPDNGEAWNNIAALWMHLGGYRPAFAALSEAVRHKRDSWQTWENYARAALASGHYQQAARGLQNALRLSGGQRLFPDVASGLLDVLEGRPPPRDGGTSRRAAAAAAADGLRGVMRAEGGEGGATAAEGEGEEEEEGDASLTEDEAALGVPLLPLLSDVPLRPVDAETATDDATTAGAAPTAATEPGSGSASEQPQQQAQPSGSQLLCGRDREVVLTNLGAVLREAVNSPAASPGLWGSLGRYWALRGEPDSAKEARLKQVRGLAGGAFKSDPAKFAEYAEASEALCRCYITCFKLGRPGGVKDLAAGRMHLRGLLRATAENFAEEPHTARLQALLEEITQLEDAAIAASKATST